MWSPNAGGNPVVEHQLARMWKEIQDVNLRLLALVEMVRAINANAYETYQQQQGNDPK